MSHSIAWFRLNLLFVSLTKIRKYWRWILKTSKSPLFHLFQLPLDSFKSFHMIFKRFFHLFVNRHNSVDWVSFFLLVLMNYLKFDLIKSFPVTDDIFVSLVEFAKLWCCIINDIFFIRMYKFGFSPVRSSDLKVRAVFLYVKNFIAIKELHRFTEK